MNIFLTHSYLLLAILVSISANATSSLKDCEHDASSFRCVKYIKNYDADTITVEIPNVHPLLGKKISVRVAHIDTPEVKTRNSCEKTAGRSAQRLIENLLRTARRIDLVNVKRDKYFRILADVLVDNKSLKDVLLKNQLAYSYEGGTKKKVNWCGRVPASLR